MRTGVLLSLLSIIGLTGCQEDEIRKYRVPKPAPENVNAQGGAGFRYTVPEGWEKTASSGPIRTEASFVIEKDGQSAQVTVTAFPGEAGGLAANINRWRDQLGLLAGGLVECPERLFLVSPCDEPPHHGSLPLAIKLQRVPECTPKRAAQRAETPGSPSIRAPCRSPIRAAKSPYPKE